jgi:hypothetical protein
MVGLPAIVAIVFHGISGSFGNESESYRHKIESFAVRRNGSISQYKNRLAVGVALIGGEVRAPFIRVVPTEPETRIKPARPSGPIRGTRLEDNEFYVAGIGLLERNGSAKKINYMIEIVDNGIGLKGMPDTCEMVLNYEGKDAITYDGVVIDGDLSVVVN